MYIPTNPLYSSALHWTAKYLRDFILLGIHIVCMLICMCMCVCVHTQSHTHNHTIDIDLKSTYWWLEAKMSLLSHHQWE